ncbi:MAG: hypothetical protein AAGC45_08000 [Bacteroidota bacterium]
MMKTLKVLLLFLLFSSSCGNDNESVVIIESFDFFENASIVILTSNGTDFPSIENGENLVFDYGVFSDPEEDVVDDASSTSLFFEIPPTLDAFEYRNEELGEINCYFFLGNSEFSITEGVSEGTISGNRINNSSWEIAIDVAVDTREINVTGIFNLKE